jgi:toxin CptA
MLAAGWPALAIALPSAALMGLAIQRGATCMVAAIGEIVTSGKAGRALALAEASLWVAGGLALASLAGLLVMVPRGFAVDAATVLGGALLGIGAFINGACVFGAIARLGSGQWAYAATPVGFFLGCLLVDRFGPPLSHTPAAAAPALAFATPIAIGFAALLIWRIVEAARSPDFWAHLWHPYQATLLIGVTFVTTMLSVGAWSYTDALADLAGMMDGHLPLRLAMLAALLAGAIGGGWIAGVLRADMPKPMAWLRCIAGGTLMGMGGILVPGSNDGLIMTGLPLFLAHAWVAVLVMVVAIVVPMLVSRHLEARRPGVIRRA